MRKQYQAVPANHRLGAVIVVAAFLMVGILAFAAFSIDVGYICLLKAQAQNAADSAALAGGQVLVSEDRLRGYFDDVYAEARTISGQYGNLHKVGPHTSLLQPSDDVVIGRLETPDANMSFSDPATYNALVVTIKATKARNHNAPLFFAAVLGFKDVDVTATATVAYADRIAGFKTTPEHPTTTLLPITLQIESWKSQLASKSSDVWTYNEDGSVTPGPDGIPEIRLYPISSGSGNWGTVDIGNNNNSTSDLERQIREGVNQTDLAPYGGKFTINTSNRMSIQEVSRCCSMATPAFQRASRTPWLRFKASLGRSRSISRFMEAGII